MILDGGELTQPLSLPSLRYLELGEWSFEMAPLMFLENIILPPDLTICLWNIGWEANIRNLICPRLENRSLLERCTKINVTSFLCGDSACEADSLVGVKDSTLYYYGEAVPPGFSTMRSLGAFVNVTELNYCPDFRWSKHGDVLDEDLLLLLPALKILRNYYAAFWFNSNQIRNGRDPYLEDLYARRNNPLSIYAFVSHHFLRSSISRTHTITPISLNLSSYTLSMTFDRLYSLPTSERTMA
ncbi:hypothetical protein AGABI2DRAFT_195093 [Agaricus bisporus var. bisporus H97]|uniref:hypothetical protein n=1 Tax=Agaricus bisporus var. bisporus (strain H97 / ATCC MYA-4626 / FGSC 10389) TaxID=936046 RepID=UPI00029F64D7|nr:hypothetical protein AGABI2DRAFT_195093 [Agaricus bisporus var. bisporus H97]EKV43466.1 hypothetical protein AGABI2DRAFT_195093 [Agaricus bisporus var. bisporus H97]